MRYLLFLSCFLLLAGAAYAQTPGVIKIRKDSIPPKAPRTFADYRYIMIGSTYLKTGYNKSNPSAKDLWKGLWKGDEWNVYGLGITLSFDRYFAKDKKVKYYPDINASYMFIASDQLKRGNDSLTDYTAKRFQLTGGLYIGLSKDDWYGSLGIIPLLGYARSAEQAVIKQEKYTGFDQLFFYGCGITYEIGHIHIPINFQFCLDQHRAMSIFMHLGFRIPVQKLK